MVSFYKNKYFIIYFPILIFIILCPFILPCLKLSISSINTENLETYLSNQLKSLRFGLYKPYLVYSINEISLESITMRLAYLCKKKDIISVYRYKVPLHIDSPIHFNYNDGRTFSEQVFYILYYFIN